MPYFAQFPRGTTHALLHSVFITFRETAHAIFASSSRHLCVQFLGIAHDLFVSSSHPQGQAICLALS